MGISFFLERQSRPPASPEGEADGGQALYNIAKRFYDLPWLSRNQSISFRAMLI